MGTALTGQEEPYPRRLKMGRGTSCWSSWEGRRRRDLGGGVGWGGLGKEEHRRGRQGEH